MCLCVRKCGLPAAPPLLREWVEEGSWAPDRPRWLTEKNRGSFAFRRRRPVGPSFASCRFPPAGLPEVLELHWERQASWRVSAVAGEGQRSLPLLPSFLLSVSNPALLTNCGAKGKHVASLRPHLLICPLGPLWAAMEVSVCCARRLPKHGRPRHRAARRPAPSWTRPLPRGSCPT